MLCSARWRRRAGDRPSRRTSDRRLIGSSPRLARPNRSVCRSLSPSPGCTTHVCAQQPTCARRYQPVRSTTHVCADDAAGHAHQVRGEGSSSRPVRLASTTGLRCQSVLTPTKAACQPPGCDRADPGQAGVVSPIDSRRQHASVTMSEGVRPFCDAFKTLPVQPGQGQVGTSGHAMQSLRARRSSGRTLL